MTDKVVSIIEARAKKTGRNNPLDALVERAQILKKGVKKKDQTIINMDDFRSLSRFFEGNISNTLFSSKMISEDTFLCSIYIAKLLAKIGDEPPKSWYVTDFILEGNNTGNPVFFKDGADVCFLLCSLFQERAEHRSMNIKDYQQFGITLYSQYYSTTDKEIGKHMSNNFETMATVTHESVAQLLK